MIANCKRSKGSSASGLESFSLTGRRALVVRDDVRLEDACVACYARTRLSAHSRRPGASRRRTGIPAAPRLSGINRNGALAIGSGHPASAAGCRGPTARQGRDLSSEFDLFRDAERVLDLDPEIANRA